MRMHEREELVRKARLSLLESYIAWAKSPEYEALTDLEAFAIVNGLLADQLGSYFKYAIREERHGDTETPGGWAGDED